MAIYGKHPAIVKSYNAARRECRVEIPGMTDGSEVFPLAEIMYPIGDKSDHTEIRILEGDKVWIEFESGDPRFPIIVGWRTKQSGNAVGWRKFHHANVQFDADQAYKVNSQDETHTAGKTITLDAGEKVTVKVGGSTIEVSASGVEITTPKLTVTAPATTFSGAVTVNGKLTYTAGLAGSGGGAGGSVIQGGFKIEGGDVEADGITLKTHKHLEQGDGQDVGPPH